MSIGQSIIVVIMLFLPGYTTIVLSHMFLAKTPEENHNYKEFDNKQVFIPRIVFISILNLIIPYGVFFIYCCALDKLYMCFINPVDLLLHNTCIGLILYSAIFLLIPLILSFLVTKMPNSYKELFLGQMHHETAWDKFFRFIIEDDKVYFVVVTLKKGGSDTDTIVGGIERGALVDKSYAGNDLVLSTLFIKNKDDDWEKSEQNKGIFIKRDDILTIELIQPELVERH